MSGEKTKRRRTGGARGLGPRQRASVVQVRGIVLESQYINSASEPRLPTRAFSMGRRLRPVDREAARAANVSRAVIDTYIKRE